MKLNKWIALIACVVSGALPFDVLANANLDWFSGSASGKEPQAVNAGWNATLPAGVKVENSQFMLENDVDSALLLTPEDAEPSDSDGIVTVTTTATFVPVEELPEGSEMGEAKIALAVLATGEAPTYSYQGWDGSSWVKVADVPEYGIAEIDNEVTVTTNFTVVLNRRDSRLTFKVGNGVGVTQTVAATMGELASVGAYGNGSLASIDADYELAVATGKDGKAYGSLAEAKETTGSGTIAVVVSEAAQNEKAANGMPVFVCQALGLAVDQQSAKPKFVPVEVDTEAQISLKLATVKSSIPVTSIKYQVSKGNESVATFEMGKNVLIPTDTGVYSIVPVIVQ